MLFQCDITLSVATCILINNTEYMNLKLFLFFPNMYKQPKFKIKGRKQKTEQEIYKHNNSETIILSNLSDQVTQHGNT